MRTVKFRAWNNKENIMCYDNEDNSSGYWDGVIGSDVGIINSRLKVVEGYKGTYEYMQYTGIKDKSGIEIYEGDFIEIKMKCRTEIFEVYYMPERARFSLRDYKWEGFAFDDSNDMWVIGNIYENPGLLKGE